MVELFFLGTGGGRFATIYQERATGGIYIIDSLRMHLDPGPGALVSMKKVGLDPTETDLILVSHCHPDHYNDAEICIEAMTKGGIKHRGVVFASKSVIDGVDGLGPGLSKFHIALPKKVIRALPSRKLSLQDSAAIFPTPAKHSDRSTVGFKIQTSQGLISYVCDTALTPKVKSAHRNARILIVCTTRPLGARIPYHLCTEDVAELVSAINPEIVILTHFGMKFLHSNPAHQANWIWKTVGIKTIPAEDLMKVTIRDTITVEAVKNNSQTY